MYQLEPKLRSSLEAGRDSSVRASRLSRYIGRGQRSCSGFLASADSFVWLRLYQSEIEDKFPRGPEEPLWWTRRHPILFQRNNGIENRHITGTYIQTCISEVLAASGVCGVDGNPLQFTPHDFRRIFVTDALRSGLPPHIAAKICGHSSIDTTLGYAAIYPEEVVGHHRAFISRRRKLRPSEEYRELSSEEWSEFLGHFELRKVALGVCAREYNTPCVHEHSCIRCPLLRPDPQQEPRLQEILSNLRDRLKEARVNGWLGEVVAIETSLAAAEQKLESMRALGRRGSVHLGMPDVRSSAGRITNSVSDHRMEGNP
ncbi:site-specific integrase [Streptomyces avermitilis]|uniref:site-specific integrase n=1 Tax=Streptomyces avermitilis TaxID=33903 RepID=UPI0033E521DD